MAGAGAGRPYKPTSVRVYLTVGVVSSRGVGGVVPHCPLKSCFFSVIFQGVHQFTTSEETEDHVTKHPPLCPLKSSVLVRISVTPSPKGVAGDLNEWRT